MYPHHQLATQPATELAYSCRVTTHPPTTTCLIVMDPRSTILSNRGTQATTGSTRERPVTKHLKLMICTIVPVMVTQRMTFKIQIQLLAQNIMNSNIIVNSHKICSLIIITKEIIKKYKVIQASRIITEESSTKLTIRNRLTTLPVGLSQTTLTRDRWCWTTTDSLASSNTRVTPTLWPSQMKKPIKASSEGFPFKAKVMTSYPMTRKAPKPSKLSQISKCSMSSIISEEASKRSQGKRSCPLSTVVSASFSLWACLSSPRSRISSLPVQRKPRS